MGLPKSGKSTVLERLISGIPNKKGFLTKEITIGGIRKGFKIVASDGKEKVLASVDFNTQYKVSKYHVDLKGFEEILNEFFSFSKNDILYIDEIGQMELFSEKFKELVLLYMNSDNFFIGTLSKVYQDSFTKSLIQRKDIEVIEITPENREAEYQGLKSNLEK